MAHVPAEAATAVILSGMLRDIGIAARPDGKEVRAAQRRVEGAPAIAAAMRAQRPQVQRLHRLMMREGRTLNPRELLAELEAEDPTPASPPADESWAQLGEADVVLVTQRGLSDDEAAYCLERARGLRGEWAEAAVNTLMAPRAVGPGAAAVALSSMGGSDGGGGSGGGGEGDSGGVLSTPPRGGVAAARGVHPRSDGGAGGGGDGGGGDTGDAYIPSPVRLQAAGGADAEPINTSCYAMVEATRGDRSLLAKLVQVEVYATALAARAFGLVDAESALSQHPARVASIVTLIGVAAPFSLWDSTAAAGALAFVRANLPFAAHMQTQGRLLFLQLGGEHRQMGTTVAGILYAQENLSRKLQDVAAAQQDFAAAQDTLSRKVDRMAAMLDAVAAKLGVNPA